ncbi:5-(carboxyamino)imidazole ribonucleotide synthase [Gloeothece verrucosa]|uniref:N5-carboxyaminoimidazole ribonucleotide synthase n=1 Tax=Gloeothece verrucosa (strain PCC 7822) TaxID=497965 RepID=E0UHQ1_GLOV7|nr:5-(carboxyamino)imidazole ribonucleotide synthase [Gloeothece verrucosa]ADN13308.1 phosphoribosylaminoimidazole carboxylase, ATPase subunit [Gloeothece verrucosa PCC 7822]
MASKRVGVIGGGQLAWMMAGEAQALGIELIVQTPHPDDPAVSLATDVILAAIDDATATAELATRCDVITFENEFINLAALQPLEATVRFSPSLKALSPLLDKYHQRCYLQQIGLPMPHFLALEPGATSPVEVITANGFVFPLVAKARRHGYDGYGTFIVHNPLGLETLCNRDPKPLLMVEDYIPYQKELAVIAARSLNGEVKIYPVVETIQVEAVCRRVMVPALIEPEISREIEQMTRQILEQLEIVGVLGLELFLTQEGKILVNEIAPRTHNSGHYTLDACLTSQFAIQLQAVTGLPLGSIGLKSSGAAMVNLLGYEYSHQDYQSKRDQIASIPHTYLHWYGKTESRPGRKLGHVTVLTNKNWGEESVQAAQEKLLQTVKQIEQIWYF